MIAAFALLLAGTAAFGVAAGPVSRLGAPRAALWALSAGAAVLAAAGWVGLGAVLCIGVLRGAAVAHVGDWSPVVLASRSRVELSESALAGSVLVGLGVLALQRLRREVGRLRAAWSAAAASDHDLVVLDDPRPLAYAVPGRPGAGGGRIVVSRRLLADLDPRARRALLAHERAHLAEHHEVAVLVARVAAAGMPLLRGVPAAVRTACERSADEAAARAVGSRQVVADTIVRVAMPLGDVLALGGADVPARVTALLQPRRGQGAVLATLLVLAASCACLLWLGHRLDAVLDASHAIGRRRLL